MVLRLRTTPCAYVVLDTEDEERKTERILQKVTKGERGRTNEHAL